MRKICVSIQNNKSWSDFEIDWEFFLFPTFSPNKFSSENENTIGSCFLSLYALALGGCWWFVISVFYTTKHGKLGISGFLEMTEFEYFLYPILPHRTRNAMGNDLRVEILSSPSPFQLLTWLDFSSYCCVVLFFSVQMKSPKFHSNSDSDEKKNSFRNMLPTLDMPWKSQTLYNKIRPFSAIHSIVRIFFCLRISHM